ncbi:CueP family metal-binding protein, partial [Corynebacterium striatum]
MKRLISLAAACAAAITLSSCSTDSPEPSEASKGDTAATDIQQVPAEDILAEFDLEGLDGPEIIDKLDRMPKEERPSDLHASVLPHELVLTAEQGQASLPLPEDKFYVSIAPYMTQTHDCFNHSLTTCTGELSKEDIHVTITDDEGNELVNEDTTTFDNGFIGYWLPADKKGTIT